MPVNITSILFQDEYTGSESIGSDPGSPNFIADVGDLMYMVGLFDVSWSALNKEMKFLASDKSITRTDLGSFITDGFQKGDSITITGTAANDGNYTVASVSTSIMTVTTSVTTETDSSTNIYGTTPVNYLDFYYNLVGNNDQLTFKSLTDNEGIQRFTGSVNEIYGNFFTLEPNATSKAWYNNVVDGNPCVPTIESLGTSTDHKQQFKIVFPFLVTPFFKADQLLQLQNAYTQNNTPNPPDFIPPSYFADQCLGFLQQIDAKFSLTSSKADHTSGQVFTRGSTAWYNEFFPTGTVFGGSVITDSQYDFISISYKDAGGNTLSSFDYNQVTDVQIKISNVNNSFGAAFPFVLNFCWAPTNSSVYQGYSQPNQNNLRKAFLHDRCFTTLGASADGDQFGTSTQVIKTVTSSVVANQFILNFKIDLGSYCKSVFNNVDNNKDFFIWVTPQQTSVTTLETTNRNAVLCDVNTAFTNTDDDTLLTIVGGDVHFFSPVAPTTPFTSYYGNTGEYGYAKCDFLVNAGCIIESINISFEAQLISDLGEILSSFPIEQWNNSTGDFYDGETTQLSIIQSRNFTLPDDSLYNTRIITRKSSLDVGTGYYATQYGFEIIYGFQMGYQFWQPISQFDKHYLRYHTQYWAIYSQGFVGADQPANNGRYLIGDNHTRIKMKFEWNITDTSTGITTNFVRYCDVYCADAAGNVTQQEGTTFTYDMFGKDLNGGISLVGPTRIISNFEDKSASTTIGAPTTVGELVAYYETGSENVFDRILTNDADIETSNSLWVGVPTITYTGFNVVVSGIIDFSKAPAGTINPRLYARINYA